MYHRGYLTHILCNIRSNQNRFSAKNTIVGIRTHRHKHTHTHRNTSTHAHTRTNTPYTPFVSHFDADVSCSVDCATVLGAQRQIEYFPELCFALWQLFVYSWTSLITSIRCMCVWCVCVMYVFVYVCLCMRVQQCECVICVMCVMCVAVLCKT